MEFKSKPIVICAEQRSGTTALCRALEATGKVKSYGEIFHTGDGAAASETNFFNWAENNSDLTFCFRRPQDAKNAFSRYLRFLDDRSDRPYFLIDIKYNSWVHFNAGWFDPTKQPFMMAVLKQLGVPFVHLVRMNSFLRFFSSRYAAETNKWHHDSSARAVQDVNFSIDPNSAYASVESSQQCIRNFRRFLKGYENAAEVIYEKMYDGPELTEYAVEALADVIRESWVDGITTPLNKTPVVPGQVLSNVPSILARFRGTEFEWMVTDSLI